MQHTHSRVKSEGRGERPEIHLVGGTRPEAVKLAPVASAMARRGRLRPVIVASGQHPLLFEQALTAFDQRPEIRLDVERRTGSQAELLGHTVNALDAVFADRRPAAVVVQGDTTTTLAGALAAFWRRIPVVHLEAGLRSHDLAAPFPEEGNRRLVGQISALHLAPTARAAANLADEGIAGPDVLVVGNTSVDAVLDVAAKAAPFSDPRLDALAARARSGRSRLVLVTAHRREAWGRPLDEVLVAVRTLVATHRDIEVVLPAHPNPAVREQVDRALGDVERALVTDPLPYPDLARLLGLATLVLSDSGGIQEEAPSFGVPVLVLRDVTERGEAVEAGCALLVGTDRERVLATAHHLLTDEAARVAMTSRGNPFGDGRAGERTEHAVAWLLGLDGRRPAELVSSAVEPVA
ncbi:UDP-N-Acetylglucosamine 2-epimerase [Streptoalloteichus tenebrarius]|uniref:UDP-N-acetylglucosamine 2-epimerase (non-hydrolyzing) n=1 Tax=Streptoalloteichus tenebrarius (strain ATCC 17920 / DSM 40477 / JCM 4838 / CBS 697.72 / NBRC 16177 / NCIMB 11028 / NRRL B-12390 / A12253. 1 / ISP 5477) TaxID=1933 RepID=A0ABT1HTM6_STRSD|nr:UDP-N-Acetylglucosamine 2-epimerase [Streptoalloteichus tenebrarius]